MFGNLNFESVALLPAEPCTDTADATGTWTLVTNYEGAMIVTQCVGTVTAGNIAGAIYTALDTDGGSSAAVTGATFTTVTTANDPKTESIMVQCNACGPYVKYVGTVTTGPADVSVTLTGCPKY